GHAAPHARDYRVGAVFLDVGVGAFVDQARLRVVLGLARPGGNQVIVECRATGGTAVGCLPVHEGHGVAQAGQVVVADGFAYLAVGQLAAAANGFLAFRLDVCRTADGTDEDLLDQADAGTAGTAGLGVLLDLVHREQAVLLDGLDDGAFAHAIAAAHFHAIGHVGGAALALVANIPGGTFAKHQVVANGRDIGLFTDLPEIPAAIGGITIQAGADQHVILEYQLLVDAADRVGEGDGLGAFAAHELAGGEQIDTGNLEFGGGHRALVTGKAELGQMIGTHLGLLEQRRHQAIGNTAVTGAFADGIDARVVGLQGVVDQDAAVAGDAG